MSIYMERVLRSLPCAPVSPKIYVAATAGLKAAMALANRGRHVVMGSDGADPKAQAQELECEYIVLQADDMPVSIKD